MNFLTNISNLSNEFHPQNPAVITSREIVTYLDLKKFAIETAGSLIKLGIKKGEYVSVLSDNNKDFVVLVFALWLIDAVPVPINIKLTSKEIEHLLLFSKGGKLLLHESLRNQFHFTNQIVFPLQPSNVHEFPDNSANDLNRIALVIFTSGSMGVPKGVMLSFKNLIRSAEIGDQILNQTSQDRWLASLPFNHIGGFSIISRALLAGASIIIPDSSDIKDFIESLNNFKPTLASFVGTQLKKLMNEKIVPPKELRNVLLGGGFIDDQLIESSINNGWKISKVYGSSETSSFVCAASHEELKGRIKSSGKILYPNEILIVDEHKNKLPLSTVGEIAIRSDAVFRGYLNNTIETGKKLINNYYYSGDLGYLDEEGFLFVEARRNDLIVSGGENVNPLEVESCILQMENVKECCVIGIEDETWGQIVVAAIVSENSKIDEYKIRNSLKKKLAGFKIPKKILFVEYIPRTSLGKIEKDKVLALFNK